MKMAGFSVLEWKAADYAPKELMIANDFSALSKMIAFEDERDHKALGDLLQHR